MSVFTACCSTETWRSLSRAAAKAAKARVRRLGGLRVADDWPTRAAVCERCPMRVIRRGVSYCGRPLLEQPMRDLQLDGCGCPTIAKAKAPEEHCPLDASNRLAVIEQGRCSCKWCSLG